MNPPVRDVQTLLACGQCDLLHRLTPADMAAGHRSVPRCRRCGAPLLRSRAMRVDAPLALALTSLCILLIAHLHPILTLDIQGHRQAASLWQAVCTLYDEGAGLVSALVLITTLIAPAAEALVVVWVLLPLRWGRVAPGAAALLRFAQHLRPWVMVEVFMLGILVAAVKLAAVGQLHMGVGLWAFAASMLAVAAMSQLFDPEQAWALLRRTPTRQR